MKIRIGKELRISWSILTQGQNQPLEGRNLRLYLQEPNRQRRTLDFTTDANTLLTVLPANSLTRLGHYALILTENEGQEAQTAVDANPAFTLVETTEEEDTPTTEDPNLEVANINLATGNLTLRMVIQELFSGKDGGDMKTGDIIPVLRDGELHRVSAAAVGGTKKKIYKGIFHKAIPFCPKDGYAYIYRGMTFCPAFKMKDPSQFRKFVEFFKEHNDLSSAKVHIFNSIGIGERIGNVARLSVEQEVADLEQALIEYILPTEPGSEQTDFFFLILLTTTIKTPKNVVIYIDNPGDKPLPVYECNVRIVHFEDKPSIDGIEMQSPRFTIQGGRVFCTEIPTEKIHRKFDSTIWGSKRTNFYYRRTKKHGATLINHFDNIGNEVPIKMGNKRNPVRLNCGETSSFRRTKQTTSERYYRINRGRSIHTIETTVRQLANGLWGG